MTLLSKTTLSIATLLSGLGLACVSTPSYACSYEPIMASVCAMALPARFQTVGNVYTIAAGQIIPINQNPALFSLLGTTFGGDGVSTFAMPDLRGKVIVGYDARDPSRQTGATGGSTTVRLTVAQLPVHALPVSNLTVSMSGVHATTTLSGLTATANLGGMVIAGPATGLTMKALSGSNGQASPAGNYLGKAVGATSNIYASGTPNTTLNAGAIGGNLTLTVNPNTNAPVTGSATTTLDGQAVASGTTGAIGSSADVPVMPPYLVLPYYLATSGIYPSTD